MLSIHAAFAVLVAASFAAKAQTSPDEIKDRLKGQPIYLRGMWIENKLKFHADGSPEKTYKRLPFSECGIDVSSVKQKGDVLQIEGQRMGLTFDKSGMTRVRLEGKDYDGHITIDIAGNAGTDYTAAIDSIFAELGDFVPQLPDFWQSYSGALQIGYKGTFKAATQSVSPASAPAVARAAEKKPERVGAGVKPPRLVSNVEPQFSQAARMLKKSGDVEVYLWVLEDGTPTHIRVMRPVGLGLDEQAVDAVMRYKFAPATRDGVPVKVDIYMDISFKIF